MNLDQLESTLEPLFISWKKTVPNKSFGDFIFHLDNHAITKLLSGSSTPP